MKIKVAEATPLQLDWLVELAKGTHWSLNGYFCFDNPKRYDKNPEWRYSTDWAQGGPIMLQNNIGYGTDDGPGLFIANRNCLYTDRDQDGKAVLVFREIGAGYGPTPLIAGLRCWIAFKLGDEVEIPEELA